MRGRESRWKVGSEKGERTAMERDGDYKDENGEDEERMRMVEADEAEEEKREKKGSGRG